MCKGISRVELHAHTDMSNIRLRDALTKVEGLIDKAVELKLSGLAITEHESVGSHMKAVQYVEKMKKNKKIDENFKLILGNEIYLVNSLEEVRDDYVGGVTKFPHFILLAKNENGHEALRVLSSMAWEDSFMTGGMERVPTTKENLEKILKQYPNTIIGSSACLGSESSIHILNGDYDKAKEFLNWCKNIFGEGNFFLEMQPATSEEQIEVNKWLIEFSKELDLELIITNDVHYLRPEDAKIHEAFLNAKDAEREVASFYESTFLHTNEEIYEKMSYIDKKIVDKALLNTIRIGEMIENYTLEKPTVIPRVNIPKFELLHIFEKGYDQYDFIKKMAYSPEEQDRYYLSLIEKGFLENIPYTTLSKERFHEVVARINVELEQLWKLSEKLNQSMSSYYVTVQKIVSLMWNDDDCEGSRHSGSLVGSGRGSAVAWLTNYLTGITQVNPMEYGIEIPFWRHLSAEMGSISSLDVDLDINGSKKEYIFDRIKEAFGEEHFMQVCTYGTEKSKSAIQTACRGLGIDLEEAQYISSLIPFERGENYSISDCLYGNEEEGRSKVPEFIREISKYEGLVETALKIEGVINKRSVHAGGVLILNEHYTKTNAMMRSPKGTKTTQFNLDDSQAASNIKYDLLTIESLEKIQTTMDLLLENGEIEWQGSLRKTFNKYFHPEIIDKESPALFELASSGTVPDLFQFSTQVGHSAIVKAKPENLIEMTATNSLMRLQTKGNEQPIDTFIKFKEDISLWYKEMKEYGLTQKEINVVEKHLLPLNGVADTQESVMLLAMDENIASFGLEEATRLRKTIASKSKEATKEIKKVLYDAGKKQGTSENLLDYVWLQISRMLSYAFSSPHTLAYSLIAMIQLNMVRQYNPVYWQTAVLTVNSGSQDEVDGDKVAKKNYGKTAATIGNLKSIGVVVEPPLINTANLSFTPDTENNRIVFSMKGISGINDEIAHTVLENRPYKSFDDFYQRMYLTKKVQRQHILQLIKAGCFSEFASTLDTMKEFILKEVDKKEKLTMQNFSSIMRFGLLDDEKHSIYKEHFNFRKYINKSVHKLLKKPKDKILKLDAAAFDFFNENYTSGSVVEQDEKYVYISLNKFDKEYNDIMEPVREIINEKEFIRDYNIAQFHELWDKHASGTPESWEMQSMTFYSDRHELDDVDNKLYGISSYESMPFDPIISSKRMWRGREVNDYKLYTIMGTVIDKDADKNLFTLLTPTGVVNVKTYSPGQYSFYNKQIKIDGKVAETSWFTRGNLLLCSGFRRGDQFILRAPRGQHTINKILYVRKDDGTLAIQSERVRA